MKKDLIVTWLVIGAIRFAISLAAIGALILIFSK